MEQTVFVFWLLVEFFWRKHFAKARDRVSPQVESLMILNVEKTFLILHNVKIFFSTLKIFMCPLQSQIKASKQKHVQSQQNNDRTTFKERCSNIIMLTLSSFLPAGRPVLSWKHVTCSLELLRNQPIAIC